ncbi:MAG: RNase adapter RapZ [Alphaproteobacteria bacterium]|nr:RNase adapter RapZ [Alphaproteobacteria bacterium]
MGVTHAEETKKTQHPLYLVTGLSGAGRSTCLHVLEDLGFEAVDNLPLNLLPALLNEALDPETGFASLAVGIDIRSHHFNVEKFISKIESLRREFARPIKIVFMDCDEASLISRYNQTRRPHPIKDAESLADAVAKERDLLQPLKEYADIVLDSSGRTIWQFRNILKDILGDGLSERLKISVMSFSFAVAVPRDADLVFDVRFLNNPHYLDELRPLTGQDQPVQDYIRKDPDWYRFFESLRGMLDITIPRYQQEGKSHLTIAIGCTGGRHRSVFTAEEVKKYLSRDWPVYLTHVRLQAISNEAGKKT